MNQIHTNKQKKYYKEVIHLYFEMGYGSKRISRLLPISDSTVLNWVRIFARENGVKLRSNMCIIKEEKKSKSSESEIKRLQERISGLEGQLLHAEIKAEAYDEMINVAEAKFKIHIRKKAGAKQ